MAIGTDSHCVLEIEFVLKPGKRRELNRSLEDLRAHEGEGHVRTTVYEDRDEPGHMVWMANWIDWEGLEIYLRGEQFGVLLGALRVLGTLKRCHVAIDEDAAGARFEHALPASRNLGRSRIIPVDLGLPEGPSERERQE